MMMSGANPNSQIWDYNRHPLTQGPQMRPPLSKGSEEGDHSSDEDFSPGQLVIDAAGYDSPLDKSFSSTPTTPGKTTPDLRTVKTEPPYLENDVEFKGLTFVGKMDVLQPPNPPDTICLYSYHWGSTHIDLITRNVGQTVVPMKNVYGRIVPGLTRNAVSNRIPKLGAKTIALSEAHINVLKKLQLPITARSHYLAVTDFIRVCVYYKRTPPSNLADFANITSHANPAEILKVFNSQKPTLVTPVFAPPPVSMEGENRQFLPPITDQSEFSSLSPERLNASLASSMGDHYPRLSPDNWTQSQSENQDEVTTSGSNLLQFITFRDGRRLSIVNEGAIPYLLNAELPDILPQANQNVIGPLRSLLNIPLEYASRPTMNALKAAGIIGIKACRAIIYKISDVIRMHSHWNVPVPQYLLDLNEGKFPTDLVDKSIVAERVPSLPMESSSVSMAVPSHVVSSSSVNLMSPTGTKVDLGVVKKKERKNSHTGLPPLSDQDLDYKYLPWGESKSITLLTPPTGEPHVAIAELVDKIFNQRSQVSLQRRTRMGIPTVPATSLQIHALRARGSIDPSSGYSKLVPLSGVIRLAKEAAIYIPPNVLEECQKYVPIESLLMAVPSPSKTIMSSTPKSSSPVKTVKKETWSPQPPTDLSKPPMEMRPDVASHPDVIIPGKAFKTAEGILFQVNWGKLKVAVFTSARGISYVGLYQIYDALFKHLVTRMNFKMRMRKLGIKSIRAPSFIRQSLIKLDALPNSSPVCGLLRISEMERLVKSYDITPPQVFYDLFLSNSKLQEMTGPDVFKDFTTSEEKLVVSYPRSVVTVTESTTSFPVMNQSRPASTFPSKTSVLQSLAKKISQKNHRLAAASSIPAAIPSRNCQSCGRSYPLAKKRCEYCDVFLVGHPCHVCKTLNYSRCNNCVKCGAALDNARLKELSPMHLKTEFMENRTGDENSYSDLPGHQRTHSESSFESHSPISSLFSAPPIRNAVLKNMFPNQTKTKDDAGVVTKTIFSGNLTSSRTCQECGTINSRKAKKCQQCRAPIQGRPCPQCSRPNHSHSTECFKCGAALPPTATKWILGGRIFRTSQQDSAATALGMTSQQLKKAEANRAPISCIRCHNAKKHGRFKCGRCGNLYSVSLLYKATGKAASTSKQTQGSVDKSHDDLLEFAQNLVLVGVGQELVPGILEKEKEFSEQLTPVEEELNTAEEEYNETLTKKTEKEIVLVDLQTELNALLVTIEKLNEQVTSLEEKEADATKVMEICPDQVKELEEKMRAYSELYDN